MTDKKIATVIGVGPGLGAALARRFAADYAVALVARNADKLIESHGKSPPPVELRSPSPLT
jgi:short-subunit dehydrogenase